MNALTSFPLLFQGDPSTLIFSTHAISSPLTYRFVASKLARQSERIIFLLFKLSTSLFPFISVPLLSDGCSDCQLEDIHLQFHRQLLEMREGLDIQVQP